MSTNAYPLRMEGRLDSGLSRWLWLFKWLLAFPHYVVLAFLWLGFVVTSIGAFFAILVTGRYPRVLFDYNVGVLRWSWRVSFYTYGALGTDRYPPFTLADVPDYPARLDVTYPEHLSRGLVLVKTWLLAIPHYIIVGLFLNGAWYIGWQAGHDAVPLRSGGLIGLLVLVAAVVLLFTGRYPASVFDLVLGLNRWVLRVAAYAGLMTDTYPPFRLDLGGPDPGALAVITEPTGPGGPPGPGAPVGAGPTQAGPPPVTTPPSPPGAGRVVALVAGALVALIGFGLLVGGVATLAIDRTQRDSAGFVHSPSQRLTTTTSALSSQRLDIHLSGADPVRLDRVLGDVSVRVTGNGSTPILVGVASQDVADAYLGTFRHAEVTRIGGSTVTYRIVGSGTPTTLPGSIAWSASVTGTGPQTLRWHPSNGEWVVVVMNADGSPGVTVRADVAAELPVLSWLAVALLVSGFVLLVLAAVPIILVARRPSV